MMIIKSTARYLPEAIKKPLRFAIRLLALSLGFPIKVHGVKVFVRQIKTWEIRKQLIENRYERHEWWHMKRLIHPQDRVLELGSALGVMTCSAALAAPQGCVLAYEPNPAMAEMGRKHIQLNNILNAEIKTGVVKQKKGTTAFYVADEFWSSSLTPIKNAEQIETNADALNEVLTSFKPTLLIMDIEGGEYDLLALQILQASSISKMVVEFHCVSGLEEKFQTLKPLFETFSTSCSSEEAQELLKKYGNLIMSFSRDNESYLE